MKRIQDGLTENFGLVGKSLRRYLATTALTATGLMAIASPALADNWTDHVADEGSISIDTSVPNTTNIKQSTDFVKVHGDGDINAGWTVNVAQPSSSSKYVLYDTEGDPTKIMGSLNANGRIYIFDQNGVIFGAGSRVNVGSIIASTGTISDDNIKADKLKFVNVGTNNAGKIVNNGSITVGEAGLAAFVGAGAENNGIISAKMGNVVLASGNTVTLDLNGDGLVEVAVDGALKNALVKNSGTIKAEGGHVALAVSAAKDAVDNVINMDGVIDVSSVSMKGGKIVLNGGSTGVVNVTGKLDASGRDGGSVKVTGQNILLDDSSVIAANALTAGNGGTIDVVADNGLIFGGDIEAKGGALSGNGGAIDTSGHGWVNLYGTVNASAVNGKNGSWLIDPTDLIISAHIDNAQGNGSSGNPFKSSNIFSYLKTSSIETALGNGSDVYITTVGTPNVFGQDGTIRMFDGITKTSSNNSTLHMTAAGSIYTNDIVSTGGKLNLDFDAVGSINMIGVTNTNGGNVDLTSSKGWVLTSTGSSINTKGGDVSFNAKGEIFHFGTIDTAGGDFSANTGIRYYSDASSKVLTKGGNITIKADGPSATLLGVESSGVVYNYGLLDAAGGNVDIHQTGSFIGAANTVRTSGTGTINLVQHKTSILSSIQNAIDAIQNTGTGTNTVTVGAGNFFEDIVADVNNLVLKGANAGVNGAGVRGAETKILPSSPGIHVTADNVTVDGFDVEGAHGATDGYGIWVDNADNAAIKNNIVNNTELDGIKTDTSDSTEITNNLVTNSGRVGIYAVDATNYLVDGNKLVTNTHDIGTPYGAITTDRGSDITISDNIVDDSTQGIRVYLAGGTNSVTGNNITHVENDGIFLQQSSNTLVSGNLIGYGVDGILGTADDGTVGENGITVLSSNNVSLLSNKIANTGLDGIHIEGSNGLAVNGNTIDNTGKDGIDVRAAGGSLAINGNKIGQAAGSTIVGDGILLVNATGGVIQGNTISNTKIRPPINEEEKETGHGIYVNNGTGVLVGGPGIGDANVISNTEKDGIKIGAGSGNTVQGNNISNTTRVGIFGDGTQDLKILNNTVYSANIKDYGAIDVQKGKNVTIDGNSVSGNATSKADYGIFVNNVGGTVNVTNNTVHDIVGGTLGRGDGIRTVGTGNLTVSSNTIDNTAGDAIDVNAIDDKTTINSNVIGMGAGSTIGGNGILLTGAMGGRIQRNTINHVLGDSGVYLKDSSGVTIGVYNSGSDRGTNKIYNSAYNGITIDNSDNVNVYYNTVDHAGANGIETFDSDNVNIYGNWVRNGVGLTDNGIYAHDSSNFNATNNWVESVMAGMTFEDLTGTSNVVYGNIVKLFSADGITGDNVASLIVQKNNIHDGKGDGIYVTDSDGAKILSNTIKTLYGGGTANNSGVFVNSSDNILVDGNTISNVAWDDIKIEGGNKGTVSNNIVSNADRVGIYAANATNMVIDGNTVTHSTYTIGTPYGGITSDWGSDITIKNNTVSDGTQGIRLYLTGGTNLIDNNTLHDLNSDGIFVTDSGATRIQNNKITDVGGNGVFLNNTDNSKILRTTITNAGDNGIYVKDSDFITVGVYNSGYDRGTNKIKNVTNDGIKVENGNSVNLYYNTIDLAGANGIETVGGSDVSIFGNWVRNGVGLTKNGIYAHGGSGINATNNWVESVIAGITFEDLTGAGNSIYGNIVKLFTADGITVDNVAAANIEKNNIHDGAGNGIYAIDGDSATILSNKVSTVGEDGIHVENVGSPIFSALIEGDETPVASSVVIRGNTVSNALDDGIEVHNDDGTEFGSILIDGNTVTDSTNHGLYVSGGYNPNDRDGTGTVIVSGNIFSGFDIGAEFESGTIDLTQAGNTFDNGRIGLRFAPFTNPSGDEEGEGESPSFARISLEKAFDDVYLALVDDDAPGSTPFPETPTNFGGTIGAQTFTNITQYYVDLEPGAFTHDGASYPVWINGLNSSYDGLIPSDTGGLLSQADYDNLETRFYHYPDAAGRDIFWFGFVPAEVTIDQSDIFNTFAFFNGDVTGLNVQIRGLPSVPGGGTANAARFNNINTFAGGDKNTPNDLNNIQTAAGGDDDQSTTAQDLNNVETQAGGDNQSCWNNAASAASGGQVVNVVYGGSFDDNLAQAANCGTSF